jgi:predicted ATP-dependent serine protease
MSLTDKAKNQNLYFIGFVGVSGSFRPVKSATLTEAKNKFAKFHNVVRSDQIVASRDYDEMTKRYSKLIK